jgi:Predicted permeases
MLNIKRLYTFILQTFLPLLVMTFGICLFIVLMQFIWKYIDDMVGKGLDMVVLGELLFYAALYLVPMALPLAILLASLMTFGNLGERLELLAIKASGISLVHTMRPLIATIVLISIGAFFFQNNVMPVAQVKMFSLLYSMRQKSPELDIPEGVFYKEITGYNVYVREKDKSGLLKDMMIYDYSQGFENASVMVADSGRLKVSADKMFLVLTLHQGESFENIRQQQDSRRSSQNEAVPYRRESFSQKDILIEFDANFTRTDESLLQNQYVGKNLKDLQLSIDSMEMKLDSIKDLTVRTIVSQSYQRTFMPIVDEDESSSPEPVRMTAIKSDIATVDFDSLFQASTLGNKSAILNRAKGSVDNIKNEYLFRSISTSDESYRLRRHMTEWHSKFTLSFSCLVFFFIGAPLGAIIRKGGLGVPVIISVLLFIFYYIINNIGFKMARDGVWAIWQGMWLSSAVLAPMGVFLTYKATNDSVLFNTEAYGAYIRKLLKIKPKKAIEEIDVVPEKVKDLSELNADSALVERLSSFDDNTLKDIIRNYRNYQFNESTLPVVLAILKERGNDFWGVHLKKLNYDDSTGSMKGFTTSMKIAIVTYLLLLISFSLSMTYILIMMSIYSVCLVKGLIYYFDFYSYIDKRISNSTISLKSLGLYLLPIIIFPILRKEMTKDLNKIKW